MLFSVNIRDSELTRPMWTHFPRFLDSLTRSRLACDNFHSVDPPMNHVPNISQGTSRFSIPSCPTNARGYPIKEICSCHEKNRSLVSLASETTSGTDTKRHPGTCFLDSSILRNLISSHARKASLSAAHFWPGRIMLPDLGEISRAT